MKKTLRRSLGALLAVGAVGTAQAQIDLYSSGDGELYFNLLDTTLAQSYVLDLNVNLSEFAANPTMPLEFAPDANLQSFLAEGSGDYIWSVFAGDSTGPQAAGNATYLTTSTNLGGLTPPSNQRVWNLYGYESMLINVNAVIEGDSMISDSTEATYYNNLQRSWGLSNDFTANMAGFGTVDFYSLTVNAGTNAFLGGNNPVDVEFLTSWTFSPDGTLSAVPVPAAVWLLGSGLLGLFGFGRRRAKATA